MDILSLFWIDIVITQSVICPLYIKCIHYRQMCGMDSVIFSLALILSNSLCFKDAKEDYVYFVKVLE